ncbi:hypothetical protein WA1_41710 [Scytonema hofmannii PCC 7110]|uniref:DUF4335 domain-containing protein n=1 Tax=Scytonema hofmannii PCC 7110 TaxID=128403 RepID=A0A139WUY1_9CYAN|nr:DUF4335 domain-containing protein [Scytonema hofmannii]KYC36246.1 hypothetical protein WA1_41710 [Scytonema hofmannii PCC 7110]
MPVSNPTIRRYTPPTCTLEVLAQSSPLSRWMGKSVLKQLRFELRFDDPQLPDERKVAIRGDREQLEALCVAVTNYVQEFLQMSPESFWANFSSTRDISQASDETLVPDFTSSSTATTTINPLNDRIPRGDIYIQPNSHLTHSLFLGSLANQISGGVVELSLLQLFDLATALDEYSTDVMALPDLNSRSRVSPIPVWAPVAAVLAIGVGLAPLTWQYANSLRQEQQTARKSDASSQTIALQDSPPSNLSSPLPTLSPSNNNLLAQPLPSFGANFPLPPSTSAPSAQTFPVLPPTPGASSSTQIPSISLAPPTSTFPTSTQASPNIAALPKGALPSSGTSLTVPSTKIPPFASFPQNTASFNKTPSQRITLQPNAKQSTLTSTSRGEVPALSPDFKNPPSIPNSELGSSSSIPAIPAPLPNIPSNLSSARGINSTTGVPPLNTTTPSDTDALVARLRQGRTKNNAPTEVAANSTNDTLFDTLQISEAREFLKQRWEPPNGLKQAIEYSLLVGVDGTIERIMPLGKAARDFVDRTGMPLIGEPFVSPNKSGQSVRIRAVFSPDGKVQTFPEKE